MAMREYVNDNLLFSLRSKEDYYDKIFADKEVIAKANELGALMKKDKIFGENLSLNNKKAKALILKMLDLVMDDIKHGRYQKVNKFTCI